MAGRSSSAAGCGPSSGTSSPPPTPSRPGTRTRPGPSHSRATGKSSPPAATTPTIPYAQALGCGDGPAGAGLEGPRGHDRRGRLPARRRRPRDGGPAGEGQPPPLGTRDREAGGDARRPHGRRPLARLPPGQGRLASAGSDRTIRLWDVAARRCIRELTGHSDTIRQVAFSPDGRTLASVGNDAAVRLWDPDRAGPLWEWKGGVKIAAAAFSPDGRILAWAHEDGVIQRLDLARKHRLAPSHVEHDELRSLAFSPDGLTLAAAGRSGNIHLCDPLSGEVTLTLDGDRRVQANACTSRPTARRWPPAGTTAASGYWWRQVGGPGLRESPAASAARDGAGGGARAGGGGHGASGHPSGAPGGGAAARGCGRRACGRRGARSCGPIRGSRPAGGRSP